MTFVARFWHVLAKRIRRKIYESSVNLINVLSICAHKYVLSYSKHHLLYMPLFSPSSPDDQQQQLQPLKVSSSSSSNLPPSSLLGHLHINDADMVPSTRMELLAGLPPRAVELRSIAAASWGCFVVTTGVVYVYLGISTELLAQEVRSWRSFLTSLPEKNSWAEAGDAGVQPQILCAGECS